MRPNLFRLAILITSSVAALSMPAGAADPPLKSGFDKACFDLTVRPGDNFFQYVNGNWIKANPIPAEQSRWGNFAEVDERNLAELHTLLENLGAPGRELTDDQRKLRDLYLTAMDEGKLDRLGASPLAADLERISKVTGSDELIALLADFRSRGLGFIFHFQIDQDEKHSTRYAGHLWQGGLGLPERDYYLGTTEDSKRILMQYRQHVAVMLQLIGDKPESATAGAEAVLRIETKLAEASRTPVAQRDAEANYNLKTPAEMSALTPNIRWEAYLKTIGIAGPRDMIVGQPEFLQRVDEMLKSVPASDWQAYLRWHLVHSLAHYLSPSIEQEDYQFFSVTLRGVKEMRPRWKRAVSVINREMGDALGKLYVEKYFPPAAKQRMDQLVGNLTAAYKLRIEHCEWMSEPTRQKALAKLASMVCKIGYPVKWRDYSKLEITPDAYVLNVLRCTAFESQYRIGRLDLPVNRDEWGMTPPTVNAYYSSSKNEIVFPAGILQPPFFDLQADDAVNYGAIGAVIGHEMTHGFDDQGSRSDAEGNLKNWWTAEDRARFEARAQRVVEQFDACVALDNLHVNGKLTLGENLADLGGVTISYDAYIHSLDGKPAPVIDGFTGPQRFFIGYAQAWRGASRDAELRLRLRTDPHSPVQFRALVPLSNVKAFYDAFEVKPGDKMYRSPEDRAGVW